MANEETADQPPSDRELTLISVSAEDSAAATPAMEPDSSESAAIGAEPGAGEVPAATESPQSDPAPESDPVQETVTEAEAAEEIVAEAATSVLPVTPGDSDTTGEIPVVEATEEVVTAEVDSEVVVEATEEVVTAEVGSEVVVEEEAPAAETAVLAAVSSAPEPAPEPPVVPDGPPKRSWLGLWAIVLAVLGLGPLPIIGSVLAIVLARIALRRGSGYRVVGGRPLALVSFWLGTVTLAVVAIVVTTYALVTAFAAS